MATKTNEGPRRVIYLVDADEALRSRSSERLNELGYTVCEFDQLALAIEEGRVIRVVRS